MNVLVSVSSIIAAVIAIVSFVLEWEKSNPEFYLALTHKVNQETGKIYEEELHIYNKGGALENMVATPLLVLRFIGVKKYSAPVSVRVKGYFSARMNIEISKAEVAAYTSKNNFAKLRRLFEAFVVSPPDDIVDIERVMAVAISYRSRSGNTGKVYFVGEQPVDEDQWSRVVGPDKDEMAYELDKQDYESLLRKASENSDYQRKLR